MKLIVGLGNPGKEYEKTRHNAGFRVLDALAHKLGADFGRMKFKADYAPASTVAADGEKLDLLLVKPLTFMNLSGESALGFAGFYKVALPDVLVVADDVALAVGKLRVRGSGSDGGQKGLRDIIRRLGSSEIARLRVGVGGREEGREHHPQDLAGHVLSRFSAGEESEMSVAVAHAVEACLLWAQKGLAAAMNKYN